MSKQGSNRHPAKDKPIKKRDPNRDGFHPSGHVAQQQEKVWSERDCPVEERKTRGE